jgi:hypothetical protein
MCTGTVDVGLLRALGDDEQLALLEEARQVVGQGRVAAPLRLARHLAQLAEAGARLEAQVVGAVAALEAVAAVAEKVK